MILAGISLIAGGLLVVLFLWNGLRDAQEITTLILACMPILAGGVLIIGGSRYLDKPSEAKSWSLFGDTATHGYLPNEPQQRLLDKRPYQVLFTPGAKNSPRALTVSVAARSPVPIQFNVLNWFDALCKNIGLAREYQTGDRIFDQEVYIRCPSDGFAKRFLSDPSRRRAIDALKKLGFKEVQLSGTHVEAKWLGFEPKDHPGPSLTDRAAEHLFTLAAGIPPQDPDSIGRQINTRLIAYALLWVAVLAYACLFVFVFAYPPVRILPMLAMAAAFGFLAYLAFGWVAAWLLRGESVSHDRWAALMGTSLFLFPLGSIGAINAYNGVADPHPPVIQTATIVHKRFSRNKQGNPNQHYAVIKDWVGNDNLEFMVPTSDYGRIQINQSRLKVTVGPGALGLEWVVDKQVLDR
jgi:hypothetical protein